MDEREVLNAWRDLFRGSGTTSENLATAEKLLNSIGGESPIRFRLETELEELKGEDPLPRKNASSAGRQRERESVWRPMLRNLMTVFNVSVTQMDGATTLKVTDLKNVEWLIDRLSSFFVFKTCEPVRETLNSSAYTFRVAHSSQLSASRFEGILANIAEIKMIVEPLKLPSEVSAQSLRQ